MTNRPGARFGPRSIRDASHMLCDGIHPLFNVTPVGNLVDHGDLNLPNTSLSEMRKTLEPLAENLMKKHHMVWLGGDHSVTLSLLRAQRAKVGRYSHLLSVLYLVFISCFMDNALSCDLFSPPPFPHFC